MAAIRYFRHLEEVGAKVRHVERLVYFDVTCFPLCVGRENNRTFTAYRCRFITREVESATVFRIEVYERTFVFAQMRSAPAIETPRIFIVRARYRLRAVIGIGVKTYFVSVVSALLLALRPAFGWSMAHLAALEALRAPSLVLGHSSRTFVFGTS